MKLSDKSVRDNKNSIFPCNTGKPFIFICYCSENQALVWADVATYQRHGYNIWIDISNIDKTKASWREDALSAIEDYDCKLILFYVGHDSLISEGCLNEIIHAKSEPVLATHLDSVKVLAIETEEIHDILQFRDAVYQSILTSNLDKETKVKHIKTLYRFIHDFFGGGNDRVRVRWKELRNQNDYYDEIEKYFPAETRNQAVRIGPKDKNGSSVIPKRSEVEANTPEAFERNTSTYDLLGFASRLETFPARYHYASPFVSSEMEGLVAHQCESTSLFTYDSCVREGVEPILIEAFLAQKVARNNDPSRCFHVFDVIHSMPHNWRVYLNDERKVVSYWFFTALNEEAYHRYSSGLVDESEINVDDIRYIDMPGRYKGYLLIAGTMSECRTPRIVRELYNSWIDYILRLANEDNIFFDEIATVVSTPPSISALRNIGMTQYGEYASGGYVYKYKLSHIADIHYLNNQYPNLCKLYQEEYHSDEE